ncbi:hypothetical protein AAFF_G00163370 [Aldrovandia affinis]|uniref:Uncharacterized protein n=1 Tax=Aldrovandia affinis TaxID=143900 RepID=A0AAD7SZB7_9TELE|nr:hypothetical protein AAFF_G00163370 [Aldrovandia affinis]
MAAGPMHSFRPSDTREVGGVREGASNAGRAVRGASIRRQGAVSSWREDQPRLISPAAYGTLLSVSEGRGMRCRGRPKGGRRFAGETGMIKYVHYGLGVFVL